MGPFSERQKKTKEDKGLLFSIQNLASTGFYKSVVFASNADGIIIIMVIFRGRGEFIIVVSW